MSPCPGCLINKLPASGGHTIPFANQTEVSGGAHFVGSQCQHLQKAQQHLFKLAMVVFKLGNASHPCEMDQTQLLDFNTFRTHEHAVNRHFMSLMILWLA